MTCAEANTIDLVEYLFSFGFTPIKIRGNDYWYLSPFRNEKEASFKVNKTKNVWYDHGEGKGGSVIDFTMQYFNCDLHDAMQKLSAHSAYPGTKVSPVITSSGTDLNNTNQADLITSSHQNNQSINSKNNELRPPFHLHENSLINHTNAAETAIEIIAAKKPITDLMLCRYLKERRIDKSIADRCCYEVVFKFSNKDTNHTAIGFKNSAGGYELRNSFFKLSSSPKYITYINNIEQNFNTKAAVGNNDLNVSGDLKVNNENNDKNLSGQLLIVSQNDVLKSSLHTDPKDKIEEQNQLAKQVKAIAIFEGFFDFLSYQTMHLNQQHLLTDFLVLNSLSFFERSLLLMEKHEHILLHLDHDEAGKKCLELALKRSAKYKDESHLYKDYKDLNDWVMHFGKLQKMQVLKQSNRLRL